MAAPISPTVAVCPRCEALLYRHATLGMVELMSGARHNCPTVARLAAVQASESPWEDIDT